MKLILKSFSSPIATVGFLSYGGLFECYTLELPWLDNVNSLSCIPAGTYSVTKHVSPNHGDCLKIHDVPGRTHILIHAGNFTRQTQGCILVGKMITDLDSDGIPDVSSSRVTLDKLLRSVPSKLTLEVRRCL